MTISPEIRRLAEKLRAERKRVHEDPDVCLSCLRDLTLADVTWELAAAVLFELDREHPEHAHLWKCGCLRNDGGAHRVGCPDHPEGVRGTRLS